MTERQWGTGSGLGERLVEMDSEVDDLNVGDLVPDGELLKQLAMSGSVTHEEVLLLLSAPDHIEEALRISGIRHNGTDHPSLNRLLNWSDGNRRLKVLTRSAQPDTIRRDINQGVQGVGLIRGEEAVQSGLLREVYVSWLHARSGEKSTWLRRRLIMLWTSYWVSVFHAAQGAQCAVGLLRDDSLSSSMEEREAQDAQLESLFRAMEQCSTEGVECQLELLAVRPEHAEEFIAIHNFIEEVAEQTLMDQKRFIRIRYGALLREGMDPGAAAEIARLADVIVLDSEGYEVVDSEEPVDRVSGFAAMISRIRRMKPQLTLRMNGVGITDLRMVYRQGIYEVSCQSADLAAVRIAGARLEMRRRCSP